MAPIQTLVKLSGCSPRTFFFFSSDNPFQEDINKYWFFALQVFSSMDRGTQNSGEEKEDPGDKTKSTALPSTETLSWSSEYSEMYVKCLLRSIVNSSYQGSGS